MHLDGTPEPIVTFRGWKESTGFNNMIRTVVYDFAILHPRVYGSELRRIKYTTIQPDGYWHSDDFSNYSFISDIYDYVVLAIPEPEFMDRLLAKCPVAMYLRDKTDVIKLYAMAK